jgi:ADP-heptose:LPS heptosyltransferase
MIAGRIARRLSEGGISGGMAAVLRAAGRGAFRMRGSRPWERATLDLARSGGLGDVLMCTPIVREIKRRNPGCHVRFFTNFTGLVDGLPQFDEVLSFSAHPWNAFHLEYRTPVPTGTHLAQAMALNFGMEIEDCRPDCIVRPEALSDMRQHLTGRLLAAGKPLVVVQRKASTWTVNKEWPEAYWRELGHRLRDRVVLVEIGENDGAVSPLGCHIDLRGKTTIEQLAAVISEADLLIGPDSGPVHIAAATSTPALVIYGGYLHPSHTRYDGNTGLYTQTFCAPCWLRTPCPYDLGCMMAIQPAAVETMALRLLKSRRANRTDVRVARA